ncbi:hypothetical protein ANN_07821 [Periplaneta americana]|uniref:Uncharacterized protein n=1 Tax=Periplaneta americana TaxID=6978 RepID=A0ABQ8SZN2_PERAM|nr:hypothetical protein ANN_07821 [Periplaneta americana]
MVDAVYVKNGALVSAGFEVSATVGRKEPDSDTDGASAAIAHAGGGGGGGGAENNHNTLASSGSHFTTLRTNDSVNYCRTVSEARSFDETTVQPPTKSLHSNYGSNPSSRNPNDLRASNNNHVHLCSQEAHTMAERDLGSTLLMPQTHLYKPDRVSIHRNTFFKKVQNKINMVFTSLRDHLRTYDFDHDKGKMASYWIWYLGPEFDVRGGCYWLMKTLTDCFFMDQRTVIDFRETEEQNEYEEVKYFCTRTSTA